MKKIMLIYPPGGLYQRGEDRCQSNVKSSTATSIRAANDLAYCAAILQNKNYSVFVRDYQTELLKFEDLLDDFQAYNPDVLFVSITNATIFDDIEIMGKLKKIMPNLVVILKGAIFYNPNEEILNALNLTSIDYLIGGECEFIIDKLINSHFANQKNIDEINGILYKKNEKWIKTKFNCWEENLDSLPFPNRSLLKNELYIRPDTGEAQATIVTSRGCPSACIFCATPFISGKKVRFRSAQNIFEEILECYQKYKIKNFFFRSDTFTINKDWTEELCNLIINSELNGKINWVANSRVKPFNEKLPQTMKKAGCWLIAFGIETGDEETLEKIQKGASINDAINAIKWSKKAGLKTYGFYLIGFPWENEKHLKNTHNLMFKLDTDFLELHIALPFYGTKLYEISKNESLIKNSTLGIDYFSANNDGTHFLTTSKLDEFRRNTLLLYHLRPHYIARKLINAGLNYKILSNYFKYGLNLIFNCLKK
ncbi:MAG: radical SAM protein [Candidatus Gastranaerophilales bacterium]|nr:radical SAM protein [Candidatus Gastranaerophilales bacterium]